MTAPVPEGNGGEEAETKRAAEALGEPPTKKKPHRVDVAL